jgi:hypothetical protein
VDTLSAFMPSRELQRISTYSLLQTKATARQFIVLWRCMVPHSTGLALRISETDLVCKSVNLHLVLTFFRESSGITFEEAWENRIEGLIDGEVLAQVISRDDLIRNKLEARRGQDIVDARALRAVSGEETDPVS